MIYSVFVCNQVKYLFVVSPIHLCYKNQINKISKNMTHRLVCRIQQTHRSTVTRMIIVISYTDSGISDVQRGWVLSRHSKLVGHKTTLFELFPTF